MTLASLLGLLLFQAHHAAATPNPQAMMLTRRGMVRLAWRRVQDSLVDHPDDPDLHAQAGMLLSKMAAWRDAVDAFALGGDSGALYEGGPGLRAHADALREVGRPAEAAALRESALIDIGVRGELALFQGLIADYRALGDFDAAREASLRGLAAYPGAASLLAQRATVEFEAGDREAAERWLRLADHRQPERIQQSLLLHTRIALADRDLVEARQLIQQLRRRNLRDPDVLPLLMALELLDNGGGAAIDAYEAKAWAHLDHPAARCQAVLAYLQVDDRASARAIAVDLRARYPLRADVKALDSLFVQLGW